MRVGRAFAIAVIGAATASCTPNRPIARSSTTAAAGAEGAASAPAQDPDADAGERPDGGSPALRIDGGGQPQPLGARPPQTF